MPASEQRFVLFGTGDWGEWCDGLFEQLALRGGHAAVVAAGQTESGAAAVASYRKGAKDRLDRVGIPSVDVPLLVPGDGDRATAREALNGAAFVYVLGGGPRSTVDALRDSGFIARGVVGARSLRW